MSNKVHSVSWNKIHDLQRLFLKEKALLCMKPFTFLDEFRKIKKEMESGYLIILLHETVG